MAKISIQYPSSFLSEYTYNCGDISFDVTKERKTQWLVLIDLLEKFKEICERHNLQWWADGGTLLGAVRHKGFIPWDDDIDIIMPRKDYEEYIRYASEELEEPYFNCCIQSDPLFRKMFSRLRNTSTTFISTSQDMNYRFCQGIFIDIFPLDNYPLNNAGFSLVANFISYQQTISSIRSIKGLKDPTNIDGFANEIKNIVRNYYDKANIINKMHADKYCTYSTCTVTKRYFKTCKYYVGYEEVPFEFTTIRIPIHAEECCKEQFGKDFMTPIKAKSNHSCKLLDLDNPYTMYLNLKKKYPSYPDYKPHFK